MTPSSLTKRAALLLLSVELVGCRRKSPKPEPVVVSAAPVEATPDRLPPGKLLEGSERAFGLPLPRDLPVKKAYGDMVMAEGLASPDDVADYLRFRVDAKHIEVGKDRMIFPEAKVKGANTMLRIEVIGSRFHTRLFVENRTHPPAEEGLSEAERWKRAGFSEDGRLLNADKLE